ncbi:MAG: HAMP domain-containing protein, partial [Eisenbergiella sp.]
LCPVSISEPVRQLIRVMHKTADGKWTARYENSGHDEITILGDNFNDMAEKRISSSIRSTFLRYAARKCF